VPDKDIGRDGEADVVVGSPIANRNRVGVLRALERRLKS